MRSTVRVRRGIGGTAFALAIAGWLVVAPVRPAPADAACPTAPGTAALAFSDVSATAGVVDPLVGMMVHAAAWGDVDRDGWPDLFVGSFADRPIADYQLRGATGPGPDRLLLGGPDGFRVDPSFAPMNGRTSGAVIADLDGDDWPDLVVSRNPKSSANANASAPTVVLANDGAGHLRAPITLSTTLGARSVAVLDYDVDGRPDLFIASDRWDSHPGSVLLHNDGGLRFTDVTTQVHLPSDVHGLGAAAADLDRDGWADLVVAGTRPTGVASGQAVRIFRGNGAHTFTELPGDGFHWPTATEDDDAAGVVAADVNRDGLPDLVVGQHYGSTLRYSGTGADQIGTPTGRTALVHLYLNTGPGAGGDPGFVDATVASGLPSFPTKSPDVQVGDLDNDGWPDLLTTASAAAGTRPTALRNLGTDAQGVPRFAAATGLGAAQYWVMGPLADVDRDGRLEPFLGEWYARSPSLLLHNDTPSGHWLGVRVLPLGSGYGARVEVYCAGRLGEATALLGSSEITPASGYGAGIEPTVHVGLGPVTTVDVRVVLAGNRGATDVRSVAADRVVSVQDGSTPPSTLPPPPPTTVGTAPGAPSVTTVAAQVRAIAVSFTAPTNRGSGPIAGYTAKCTSSNGGTAGSLGGPTSPLTVTGLTAAKTYTCTVTARNAVGTGPPSLPSARVVPKA